MFFILFPSNFQVHISLAGKGYMRVSWITSDRKAQASVQYGKTSGKYDSSAIGETSSYRYLLYKSGGIHHVKIGPLEPTTTYYYKCGGSGPEFSFRTPPSSFPVEFAVAGKWRPTNFLLLLKCRVPFYILIESVIFDNHENERKPSMMMSGSKAFLTFILFLIFQFLKYNFEFPNSIGYMSVLVKICTKFLCVSFFS